MITDAIVKHIFHNLGLFGKVPVSIAQEAFLTDKQISYSDDEEEKQAEVFSCSTNVEGKKLSMISTSLIALSEDKLDEITDSFVVIKLEGQPAYGCYLMMTSSQDGFIAAEIKPKVWIPTTVFLQATFLAGMEQLKNLISRYEKPSDHDVENLFTLLKEFIGYHEAFEGEEGNAR